MISTILVAHSALVPVALLLVVVVSVGVGRLVLRARPGNRRVPAVLAALTGLPVAALTLSPTPHRALQVCAVQFGWPTPTSVELLANVALFLPPVFFAALATRRPLLTLAAAAAASAAVEPSRRSRRPWDEPATPTTG